MQTIERPTQIPRRRPPWSRALLVVLGIAIVPVMALAVLTRWGVLVLLALALLTGIAMWAGQRKILFYEAAAFLIHFDGIGFGQVRMGRIVAGFAVAVILYKLVVDRWRPPAVPIRAWGPIWALLLWATLSGLWAAEAGLYINMLLMFILGLIYFGVTSMLVDSHEAVMKFLRAYWVGGLFGSAAGVLGLVLGTRSVGFGGDPNFFGLLQASMIPLTVYYRRNAPTVRAKWWYTLSLLLVLAGAAGAGSRSGLIAGAVAIVATMVTRPGLSPGRRSGVAVLALVLGALAFLVGFVANPNNLQRGFSDRGAGRLDFYTVMLPLIEEQPITGYGFGQTRLLIPPNLRVTPGSRVLDERREDVSSHNTYLDTTGDLGLVGLALFISVFAVAIVGLLRPRWPRMKVISTTLFVMMLPVFSSSMFLPLLNNKLAWCLIGLSASLQVPSWRSRWSGLSGAAPPVATALVAAPTVPPVVGAAPSAGVVSSAERAAATGGTADGSANGSVAAGGSIERSVPGAGGVGTADAPSERLAVWDLRPTRRARRAILLGAVLGGLLAGVVGGSLPTHYSATVGVLSRQVETSVSPEFVSVDYQRLQGVLTIAVSGAYAAELQRLSGVDLSVTEIRDRMSVTRPKSGNMIEIEFTDTDEANTRTVMPYLLTTLDNVFTAAREDAAAQTADEARPALPGETRYYTGPFYTPAYPDPSFAVEPPRAMWMVFVGIASGALAATGLVLAGSRRPRIEGTDDFPAVTGLRLWTHIGQGRSRRLRATPAQFEQVVARAVDARGAGSPPSRIVVTSPHHGRDSRVLALGVAAALVAEGRRVVLVDAQLRQPRLTVRLGARGRRGLADLSVADVGAHGTDLADVMRPVSPWRLPVAPRRLLGSRRDQLRFIPAGTRSARSQRLIRTEWLDRLDPEVAVVVLAPPTNGVVPVSPLLEWSDVALLMMIEGHTTTEDAEDAAGAVRLFARGSQGIVLVSA